MKKHSLIFSLLAAVLFSLGATLFSGCTEDGYWPYSPPAGWGSNYFYDSRLNGTWELYQANSSPVSDYDTNYMDFYGRGRGRYYYYSNYKPYSEEMAYFCQQSGSTTVNYQINVQYASGGASTMAYWFTDGNNSLWLQWQTGNGSTVTYIYRRVNSAPWQ